jgi:hypothetical protein
MKDQDRRQVIAEYNERLRRMAERDYFDYRHTDTTDPDPRPAIETMVERHPDPAKSKKALCYDLSLHEDSYRKYMVNPFGPPFGLVERLMQITGCFKPLYRLAWRCGFMLIPRRKISWDKRRKLMDIEELQRAWLDLQQLYIDLDPARGKSSRARVTDNRKKILSLVRLLQEQLEGIYHIIDNTDPQFSLFEDSPLPDISARRL